MQFIPYFIKKFSDVSMNMNDGIQDEWLLGLSLFPLACPIMKKINLVTLGSIYFRSRAKKFQCNIQVSES